MSQTTLTDIIASPGCGAHVLVAQEGHEINVGASILAGASVGAGRDCFKGLVAVQVKSALGLLLGPLLDLELFENRHGLGKSIAC